ncbi:MAG TPA: HEAT repeat domain-containing protein [Pyrinomonadaceae bacterium]|nr:HEAT repeat domain-containing protein [Pyrinomonadaceae bacterium]
MTTQPASGNGNNPEVKIATPAVKRVRASGPILFLAILFVIASFLTWYFTWFGRDLTDADVSKYLVDEKHPRHVQHALLQIQQRIERGDQQARQWYPQIVTLAGSPETEFRLTVAWLMGADNKSEEFHSALRKLLEDPEPIVRRNAALALVRFNDPSGRAELLAMLQPFTVTAPATGTLQSSLSSGAQISRGALLGRIEEPNREVAELRSPLTGKVDRILVANGSGLVNGAAVLTMKPDEQNIWEALRALSVVGEEADVALIERYAKGDEPVSDRIKQQAALTANTIRSRMNSKSKT